MRELTLIRFSGAIRAVTVVAAGAPRSALLCAGLLVAAFLGGYSAGTQAQAPVAAAGDFPQRVIRIVVPYPPGGVTDIAARLVAPKMADQFGQAVVVENIAAAGGVVATNALAKTAADGYTLGVVFDSFATNPFLYKGVTHDPVKDFVPISLMVRSPQLLVVNPASGIKSMAEFLRAAREPNRVMFSTPGAGTSSRLSAELLKASAGLDITLISYRGGAQALNDLLGGQVTGMIASMSLVFPHVKTGRLTALGVSSPQRTPQAPEVPPISDSIPGFEAQSWTGMIAPAGTPPAIIEKIHGAVVKALAAPDVRQRLNEQGVEVVGSSAAEFGAWLQNESSRWGRVIQERKITVD